MAGIKVPQHKIFKITTTQLRCAKWDLSLSKKEAIELEELIPLFQSQALRSIGNILKKKPIGIDYSNYVVAVIIDKSKELERAKKGFAVNGVTFKRFVGTTGGLKNDTVLFVNEEIHEELYYTSECGRNKNIPIIPAKEEAYRALFFSSSQPMPDPNGILVVKDCFIKFKDDIIKIDDSDETKEPTMELLENVEMENNVSDGFNLCTIEYMKRASEFLGLDFIATGLCLRNAWLKGMLYAFPIVEFFDKYSNEYTVNDIWGNEIDIRNVEIILTESSLKLWKGYDSIEHYVNEYKNNGFTFATTKIISDKVDQERELNYQYLQSYNFEDSDIKELCDPTINYLKDSLCGDYKSTINFLGIDGNLNDHSWQQALLTNEYMMNDPYIIDCVHRLIKQKINNAKIGKVKVSGNYQVGSGDPFALMQSICGVEPKGLLFANECYSQYWNELNIKELAIFRSPMTNHNNIRKCNVVNNEDVKYWYQYMNGVMIINGHDTFCMAENGCDWDGDLLYSTDNKVLIRKHIKLPAIQCVQRNTEKKIATEDDLILSNLNGMGNKVGSITNKVTGMKEVQSRFEIGSDEYNMLEYRMACGQLYQQNELDKIKGIDFIPMPNNWYNISACEEDEFKMSICADKKPYFFIYIYDYIKSDYLKYIKSNDEKCFRRFSCNVETLKEKEYKTEEEATFLEWYNKNFPLGIGDCSMNRICKYIEEQFKDYKGNLKVSGKFDYNILKVERRCSEKHREEIKQLLQEYVKRIADFKSNKDRQDKDSDDSIIQRQNMKSYFYDKVKECCPNDDERLNIVLDLCYGYKNNKQFCYDVIGDLIIKRLGDLKNC